MEQTIKEYSILKPVYLVTLIVLAFTGFGQMPIFKRYYLADIPGLGWTANYYITHYIHYIGAIILFCLLAYLVASYLLIGRKGLALTFPGYLRVFFLACIVITGIFRVLKNMPDITFSPGFTQFIDISHLGFVMLYACVAILFKVLRQGWIKERPLISA